MWYSAILFVVLVLFSSAIYAAMNYSIDRNINNTLSVTADSIQRNSLEIFGGRNLIVRGVDPNVFSLTKINVNSFDGSLVSTNISPDDAVWLTMRAQRGLLDSETFDAMLREPAGRRERRYSDVRLGGRLHRVVTDEITGETTGRPFGFSQVAISIEEAEASKQLLLFTLVLMGTLAMVFSAAAGVAMAQRALLPVDEITRTVLDIYKAEDLNQRVPVQTNDEVGRMAGAFNGMLERLQNVFRSQQRLVADVSHELRTPLTVVRGNAELMRTFGKADPEALDAIIGEADRMTRMVGNLLLLSQADVGQLPMKVQVLDLGMLFSDVARSATIMGAGRIEVESSACGDLIVQGDPDRIKQVLLNLVDNAIKHTPNGGKVTIAADCIEGQQVRLSVSDTGMGIPPADIPHVFERFYRVDKARSRDHGGAGLGLAIVKSIIDAHGGRIEVTSQVGKGTTFHVWLPAYQPDVL